MRDTASCGTFTTLSPDFVHPTLPDLSVSGQAAADNRSTSAGHPTSPHRTHSCERAGSWGQREGHTRQTQATTFRKKHTPALLVQQCHLLFMLVLFSSLFVIFKLKVHIWSWIFCLFSYIFKNLSASVTDLVCDTETDSNSHEFSESDVPGEEAQCALHWTKLHHQLRFWNILGLWKKHRQAVCQQHSHGIILSTGQTCFMIDVLLKWCWAEMTQNYNQIQETFTWDSYAHH